MSIMTQAVTTSPFRLSQSWDFWSRGSMELGATRVLTIGTATVDAEMAT